ncbi:MAG: N-acetyltransferase, partial [Pseudomonadota bacterium]
AEIRAVTNEDVASIAALHARVFGPGRFSRTAYRIREGAPEISTFCRQALNQGKLLAAVNFTRLTIGAAPNALLLGPLAVAPEVASKGLGRRLIAAGLEEAKLQGIQLVILVGDKPYYERFGFDRVPPGQIKFPGPVAPDRILAWQSEPDAVQKFSGLVVADRM